MARDSQSASDGGPIYEVERDRHGLMYSGPLGVGEIVQVVPAARLETVIDAAVDLLQVDGSHGLWDATLARVARERLVKACGGAVLPLSDEDLRGRWEEAADA